MDFWVSTKNIGAIYPGLFSKPLDCRSVFIGRERLIGPFFYNPFELYNSGVLTSPNLMVFGQIGYGKSAFVKAILSRHMEIGYSGCALDPKGEYNSLSESLGGITVSFGRGPGTGLNPLATSVDGPGTLSCDSGGYASQLDNLILTFNAIEQREISSLESFILEDVLLDAGRNRQQIDLFDVYNQLAHPNLSTLEGITGSAAEISQLCGRLALELRRFLFGDLRGVIDGHKDIGNQLIASRKLIHLDLFSALRPEVMRVGVPVFLALLSKQLSQGSDRYLIALDEAWVALSSPGCIGFFRSYWKLARGYGIANIAVVHRTEDLLATGDLGSANERIANGLISDSQTFVIFHLDPAPARKLGEVLDLSQREISLIGTLPRGSCLWKVADSSFLVDVMLTDSELNLFNTDQRMGN